MRVQETTLQMLISGMKQFRVPLFQRTYTWTEHDHAQLWRDVLHQYETVRGAAAASVPSRHFLGSFVLASTPATATLPAFLVVDGQQRLTTLTLALCALRDAAAAVDPEAFDRITQQYLLNGYAKGEDRWKLVPTEADKESYFACVTGKGPGGDKGRVSAAYRFFRAQLALPGPDDEPLDLEVLEQAIVSRLAIVDITADVGDNVHRIFESLNATGVGLTQGDLLRNYLFMLLPTRGREVYEEVWLPMETSLGSDNLEALARVDLRRRGVDVRDDEVYRAQQERLRPFEGDEAAVEAEVRDLSVRAEQFATILDPTLEVHAGIRRRLSFQSRWRATTAHPIIMILLDRRQRGLLSDEDVEAGLANLESFLVRRLLVGASTRNLNRIFIQLAAHLAANPDEPTVEAIRTQLSTGRKFWATDDEVRSAARTRPFYLNGRAEQRRLILERLEESFGHKEQSELAGLQLTVEHVMPQTLTPEWATMLAVDGNDPAETHQQLLHTLGNLSLSGYNTELSNHAFERKQQFYADSHLSLNKALVETDTWGSAEILQRADQLAERAAGIWPGPVAGLSDSPEGFDWTRIDAAIAAVPPGRWTAYTDLAALGGTSAVAVGVHIGAHPALPNAWRVLTAGGRISDGFRWPDPDDSRLPLEVLVAEGSPSVLTALRTRASDSAPSS